MRPFNPTLEERRVVAEIMDQPDLDSARHEHALIGLTRLNRASRSAALLWRPIQAMLRRTGMKKLSILDVASGAGDNLLRIAQLARRAGVQTALTGFDLSPVAIRHAQRRCRTAHVEVQWRQGDVLSDTWAQQHDVVTCSLFMHHLSRDQQVALLRNMKRAALRQVVIVDLLRCRAGYFLAWAASRILTTSDVVRTDALRSVNAALTIPEVMRVFEAAGMEGAIVSRRWPFRWVATWEPADV